MKQVTNVPIHGRSTNQQQLATVKDPENFIHLVKQFSRELGENTSQEGELDSSDTTDTAAAEDVEEVLASDSEQTEELPKELPTDIVGQAEIPIGETADWPQFLGIQGVISNELQQIDNESLLSTQEMGIPADTDSVAFDPVVQLTEAPLQNENSFGIARGQTPVFTNKALVETDEASLALEVDRPIVEAEESSDLQGTLQQGDTSENLLVTNQVSNTITNSLSEPVIANQSTSEIAIDVLPIASGNTSKLPQTATLDVSNLLTQSNQEPTPVMVKQVVEPLTQKIEQLMQSSEKKIILQLIPGKLGKVQIALEVNAKGSRLEFTVEQQQTRQLLSSIKSELDHVLQKQENRLFTVNEGISKEMPITSIERTSLAQGSLASFASTADGQAAQQSFSQPQRQTNKKVFNPVPMAKEEASELVNHAISILA